MIIPLIIVLISFLSAIAVVAPMLSTVIDKNGKGFKVFKNNGLLFFVAVVALVVMPLVQYFVQRNIDEKKEFNQAEDQRKRDSTMKDRYDSSLIFMKRSFDTSNNKTTFILADNLGRYGYKFDSSTDVITKIVKDSSKTRVMTTANPIFLIANVDERMGIELIKYTGKELNLKLNFASFDASSCCFSITCSNVIGDSTDHIEYIGDLTPLDYRFKLGADQSMIVYDNIIGVTSLPTMLYVWARGTYKNSDQTKLSELDEVYWYNFKTKRFGNMKGYTRNRIIRLVSSSKVK